MLVESGLQEHLAKQKLAALSAAGIAASLERTRAGFVLSLDSGPLANRLAAEAGRLDTIHQWVLEAAVAQGIELRPYKATDRAEILAALALSWEEDVATPQGAARLWHELVWAQGFPNGNHRTATAFVEAVLNPRGSVLRDLAARPAWLDKLFIDSKRLVAEKEFAPEPAKAKKQHLELARQAFREWLNQEGAR